MIDGAAKYLLIVSIFVLACMISYIKIVIRNHVEDMQEDRNDSRQNVVSTRRLVQLEENHPMLEMGK
jgi:hypothetical protein